jgi:hypothetical protein
MATETYLAASDASGKERKGGSEHVTPGAASPPTYGDHESVLTDEVFAYDDSQKLGYTGTVFVILNKMIGTGSTFFISAFCFPSRLRRDGAECVVYLT